MTNYEVLNSKSNPQMYFTVGDKAVLQITGTGTVLLLRQIANSAPYMPVTDMDGVLYEWSSADGVLVNTIIESGVSGIGYSVLCTDGEVEVRVRG